MAADTRLTRATGALSRRRRSLFGTIFFTVLSVFALLVAITAPMAVAVPPGPQLPPTASSGTPLIRTAYNLKYGGSTYHVYADGINWAKPVGIMYYFDGDYYEKSYSKVEQPTGSVMTRMAARAAKDNLVLVAPVTPSAATKKNGWTWWEKAPANAKWFREFSDMMEGKIKPAHNRVWYMGYSGGAEFISFEIAARSQTAYEGGGTILLAGGGKPNAYKEPPFEVKSNLPMHWFVGSEDKAGQTNPPTWSAYKAAKDGHDFYKKKGFRTTFNSLAGLGHKDYNLPSIMDAGLSKNVPEISVGFRDLPKGYLFVDEILWLRDQGIATGYKDGTFKPRRQITREAMAAFMYRYAGKPAFSPPKTSPFPDVPTTHDFYKEIAWLERQGITTGYDDGKFKPRTKISREAMAAFLYRYENPRADGKSPAHFSDVPTSHLFHKEIVWLAGTGISNGWADGTFRPQNKISREATAAFLYRLDRG